MGESSHDSETSRRSLEAKSLIQADHNSHVATRCMHVAYLLSCALALLLALWELQVLSVDALRVKSVALPVALARVVAQVR